MLSNTTIEGLHTLRLQAMATGVIEQREQPDYAALGFEDRLGLLVDLVNADPKGERAPVENGSTLSLKLLGDRSLVHRLAA